MISVFDLPPNSSCTSHASVGSNSIRMLPPSSSLRSVLSSEMSAKVFNGSNSARMMQTMRELIVATLRNYRFVFCTTCDHCAEIVTAENFLPSKWRSENIRPLPAILILDQSVKAHACCTRARTKDLKELLTIL